MFETPNNNMNNVSPMMTAPSWMNQGSPSVNSNMQMQQQPQPQQGFSHGGRARRTKMIEAHFNPRELDVLDHWQGSCDRHKHSQKRSYSKLEKILENPHVMASIHHHAKEHHAAHGGYMIDDGMGYHGGMGNPMTHSQRHYGGEPVGRGPMGGVHYGEPHYAHGGMAHGGMEHHAQSRDGRYGDTEIALIGPRLRHTLDVLAGHRSHNPMDGHPEYFSLSGLFSGLGNTLSGLYHNPEFRKVARTGLELGGGALGGALGALTSPWTGPMGAIGGGAAGTGLGSYLGNKFFNEEQPAKPGIGDAVSQGLHGYANARNANLGHQEAAQRGLGTALQSHAQMMPNNLLARGVGAAGSSLEGGHGIRNAAQAGFNATGGVPAALAMGRDALQSRFQGGQSPLSALKLAAQGYTEPEYGPHLPPHHAYHGGRQY
jgi:hypothetical protein